MMNKQFTPHNKYFCQKEVEDHLNLNYVLYSVRHRKKVH